jgi:acetyl-CoA carboxylase carboxyl transferase subunit alpha
MPPEERRKFNCSWLLAGGSIARLPAMRHQLDFEKPIVEMQNKLEELKKHRAAHSLDVSLEDEVASMERKLEETKRQIFLNLTAWERIKIARHPKRPFTLDYLQTAFTGFSQLHGDRLFAEDRAVVGGFARLGSHKVMVIGTQKGRDTKENILRNFGSAHPEGYRKALRLMRLADKFHLPIITLIDTAGAYPGIGAEERHIAEAIAVNLREMMLLEAPIIAAVIGEGGSGGALGIGVADRVLILENAYYSVISPEGCAAILWKDRAAAAKAAEALKITAKDLLELGLVDEIVPEPLGGAHTNQGLMAENLKSALLKHLVDLLKTSAADRLKRRYAKFRSYGHFAEKKPASQIQAANDEIQQNGP